MLNIHLKIEAKKDIMSGSNTLVATFFPEHLERSKALNLLYRVFEKDCFVLPYTVQKLSKKARRKTTI